jgi:predicted nucleotidyltransferase
MEKILNAIVAYIVHIANPEEIILFGSLASGNANKHSDIDLLIISEDTFYQHKTTQIIKGFIAQLGFQSDIIFLNSKALSNELNNPLGLLYYALKTQRKIYKKSA